MLSFLVEAIVVGIIVVIIGSFIQKISRSGMVKMNNMKIELFLTGLVTHVLC